MTAVVGLMLPEVSTARRSRVCEPATREVYWKGLGQVAHEPLSSLHWIVLSGSAVAANDAVVALVGLAGWFETTGASGAVRSTVQTMLVVTLVVVVVSASVLIWYALTL